MAYEQAAYLPVADALESRLCEDVALARDWVASTLYCTREEQGAPQEALCRAILVLDQAKKVRFIRQLQADVDTTNAKLAFLDNNVIHDIDMYDNLMMTGVDLEALVLLNKQEKKFIGTAGV